MGNSVGGTKRAEMTSCLLLLAAAVLYRPLTFWANNAWDLTAPHTIFLTAALEFVLVVGVVAAISRWTDHVSVVAVVVGIMTFVALNVTYFRSLPSLLILFATTALGTFLVVTKDWGLRFVTGVFVGGLIVAPAWLVVVEHIAGKTPYSVQVTQAFDDESRPMPGVEDVVVLIVDGYPMPSVAEMFFDHHTDALRNHLTALGFTTPMVSWSHNTITSLSIPTLLQMRQVVTRSGGTPSHQLRNEIAGGHNRVVETLTNAGFLYTHIESGWHGDVCGHVDRCLRRPLLDGAQWAMLESSLLASAMESRLGSPHLLGTNQTLAHFRSLESLGDGTRDLIYAHLLLPHAPRIVDEMCGLKREVERSDGDAAIRDQLACVDSMLIEIANLLPRETVVLIVGDHGTATGGQSTKPTRDWTDRDIAERLGALLAYRLPPGCPSPSYPSNLDAMRTVVSCAVATRPIEGDRSFIIGENSARPIGEQRLEEIENHTLVKHS